MRALQAISIFLILLDLASRRVAVLTDVKVRDRLMLIASGAYAAAIAAIPWQALRGESTVHRDAATVSTRP